MMPILIFWLFIMWLLLLLGGKPSGMPLDQLGNEPRDRASCLNRTLAIGHTKKDKASGVQTVFGYTGLKIGEVTSQGVVRLYMRGPSFGVTHLYYSVEEFMTEWPDGFKLVSCYATRREV